MSGTFGYQATEENNQNSALCKTVQGGLRILNMNGLGLAGLALPDCLMGKTSTLEEIRLGTASSQLTAACERHCEATVTGAQHLVLQLCGHTRRLCTRLAPCRHMRP